MLATEHFENQDKKREFFREPSENISAVTIWQLSLKKLLIPLYKRHFRKEIVWLDISLQIFPIFGNFAS